MGSNPILSSTEGSPNGMELLWNSSGFGYAGSTPVPSAKNTPRKGSHMSLNGFKEWKRKAAEVVRKFSKFWTEFPLAWRRIPSDKNGDVLAIVTSPYEMPEVSYDELTRIQDLEAKGGAVFPPSEEKKG